MNDPLPVEQSHPNLLRMLSWSKGVRKMLNASGFALLCACGLCGCQGTATSLRQSFGNFGAGLQNMGAPSRVPPPAQGSFQTNGPYSTSAAGAPQGGTTNAARSIGAPTFNSSGSGTNSINSFNSGTKSTMNNGPSPLLQSLTAAESQLLNATNNARNTVNRTADQLNSSVELASARVDRFGAGVVQAGSILAEAAAPIEPANIQRRETEYDDQPLVSVPSGAAGRIADSNSDSNASWRKPSRP